ncbi:MAG: NUDIX hydrolase [Armatimonadota bacterium]|nr:NUDIX hydrolase [Armatimonadota bacterium]
MSVDLAAFLAPLPPDHEETIAWAEGRMPLQVASYLSRQPPPLEFVTSVRAVVLQNDAVMVITDPDQKVNLLPGGRREAGETLEETVRREVREETGWELGHIARLGFKYFHHLAPKAFNYSYPYPDFLQVIYTAQATQWTPEARQWDEWVVESGLRSLAEVRALALAASDRLYLEAALKSGSPELGLEGRPCNFSPDRVSE